jgi:hypothetical protein
VAIGLLTDLSRESVAAILPKAGSFTFFDESSAKN